MCSVIGQVVMCTGPKKTLKFQSTSKCSASVALPMALYKYVYDYDYDYVSKIY